MAATAAVVQWLLVLALLVGHSQGQSEASITGLVDNSTLTEWGLFRTISSQVLSEGIGRSERQFLFPGLRFRCSGNVTKWIVGALFFVTSPTRHPALGIYRDRPGGGFADRVAATVLEQQHGTQIYEFTPDPPLPFQTSDSLGIYLPPNNELSLRLLYRQVINGPASRNYVPSNPPALGVSTFNFSSAPTEETDRLPLVAVEIESDDPDSADCTRDFMSRDLLELSVSSSYFSAPQGQQFVFTSSNFTSDGVVTSWTVAALWRDGVNRITFPVLQIWRRRSGDTYDRIASTEITATAESPNQLYSGTIDPPLQFQSGDLLGIYLPPPLGSNGARLLVYFSRHAESTYESTFTDEPLSSIIILTGLTGLGFGIGRPFLALGTSPPPVPTTGTTTTATATTTSTSTLSTVSVSIPAAVGGTVGGLLGGVVIGTVTVLIIVAAVARARKKNQNAESVPAIDTTATTAERTYDNPFQHETTTASTKRNEAYGTALGGDTTAAEY